MIAAARVGPNQEKDQAIVSLEQLQKLYYAFFGCCDGDDILNDMDRWTRVVVGALIPIFFSAEPLTDDMLEQPSGTGKQKLVVSRVGTTKFVNLATDPTLPFGKFPLRVWVGLALLHNPILFPVEDVFVDIEDDKCREAMEQTQIDEVYPKPNVVFENPESDGAMTRQAFYGLAAHRLQEVDRTEKRALKGAVFKVDLLKMSQFPVRSGFAKYGACAYFDKNQNVLSITLPNHGTVKPGDPKWQHAKFAWRSSLITVVTAVDHLYNNHFCVAAQMLRACTVALSENHLVRRALQPFLMRTAMINNEAGEALLPRESIVHRITSLTWDGLVQLAAAAYKKGPEWIPLPLLIKRKGSKIQKLVKQGKLPLYQDGLEIYDAFFHYWDSVVGDLDVERDEELEEFWFLLLLYTETRDLPSELSRSVLVNCLANFSYLVTAGHEHVGSISEHIATPRHGSLRIRPMSTRADKQSFLGTSLLMALTSKRTPPLQSNFANYWRSSEEKAHWQNLQENLKVVEETIDKRNKKRPFQVVSANPRFLECAVSV